MSRRPPPSPDFDEPPEWTKRDFATAMSLKDMFPAQYEAFAAANVGRPRLEQPKVHIGFRLAADVVQGVRATGRGYNASVERVLHAALAKREL